MKKIMQTIVFALCFLMVFVSAVTLLPLMNENHKAVDHSKTTVPEVTTSTDDVGSESDTEPESETTEPETPSPVMYMHTVSLSSGGEDSPLIVYTFEVTSSSGSEFNSLSDVPDGFYSCTYNGSPISNFKIVQGDPFLLSIDNEWYSFSFERFSDVVTPA